MALDILLYIETALVALMIVVMGMRFLLPSSAREVILKAYYSVVPHHHA
jgi:hypothetical protein